MTTPARRLRRRSLLAAGLGVATVGGVGGCSRVERGPAVSAARPVVPASWVGASHERGHRLRHPGDHSAASSGQASARRAAVLIVGAGVAGLAAARAFMQQGIDDVHVLELEDAAGGNARAHAMDGFACPLGAHYLPVPGREAREVGEWLHEIGLLATDATGRTRADERHLCHSPQERLFFEGQWIDGLLPPAAPGSARLAQYRRFGDLVAGLRRGGGGSRSGRPAFTLPAHRSAWDAPVAALDRLTFAAWLGEQGLDDAALTTYLDYCCRDDYGAGLDTVSAWAGIHYFASRHGFNPPGPNGLSGEGSEGGEGTREAVFTWPEGNAWLTRRLATPLGEGRLHTGQTVLAVREERHHVSVLAFDEGAQAMRAWQAEVVVVAMPVFAAARVAVPASAPLVSALRAAASTVTHAPWLVANLRLAEPLLPRASGAPAAWDNVIHGGRGLGYVDARHQRLDPVEAPSQGTVLTAYHALPAGERGALLERDAAFWAERVLAEIELAHPDVRRRVARVDLMRYGHAMAVPRPGLQRHPALAALRAARGRLRFAHSDLAGYSVFEEAFTAGCEVAKPGLPLRSA